MKTKKLVGHCWGDKGVDWQGITDAAEFIGRWLAKWPRMCVTQYKEKWGTVRVYCSFGFYGFYSLWRPTYHWIPEWWPLRLDLWISHKIRSFINIWLIPLQQKAYRWRYKQAIKKWPHLKDEIVTCADYDELLEGL